MQIPGRTLILITLAVSVAMAGGAWWFHYQSSRQAAQYWGAEAAELLTGSEKVAWIELAADRADAGDAGEVAGLPIASQYDLSTKPGLVHFRHSLTQDASFEWPPVAAEQVDAGARWRHAIRFADVDRELVVLVQDDFARLGKVDRQGRVHPLRSPRLAPALKQYLLDVGAPVAPEPVVTEPADASNAPQ